MGKYFKAPASIGGAWVGILFAFMFAWEFPLWLALLLGALLFVVTSVVFNLGTPTDEEPWAKVARGESPETS